MNADDLRAVAAEIRHRADAATTGDGPTLSRFWFAHHEHTFGAGHYEVIACDEGSFIVEHTTKQAAEHIAAWHPAVALAVADWLNETARQMDFRKDGAVVDLRFVTRAEAVVKAWRGES